MNKKLSRVLSVLLVIMIAVVAYFVRSQNTVSYSESVMNVPAFSGEPYAVINDNEPEFSPEDMTVDAYEYYSQLDYLGRCGYVMACIGRELMPAEDRESISQVKPTGWVQAQYDIVDGKSLYNRCHLIGFQLTGENANEQNLITGTRYLNVEGMLPFENMVADYIKETGNHVLYRVTPVFDGDSLVARGVQMEAKSVEDNGDGICFNIYAYNNQPGVTIDYATGESVLAGEEQKSTTAGEENTYLINVNSRKFHKSTCEQGMQIKEENKEEYTGSRADLIADGYAPAGCCAP